MLQEEYIKNNTIFFKKAIQYKYSLFKENVVFVTSNRLEENINALFKEEDINTIRLTSHDYKLDNLDFLKNYDFSKIRSINILSDSIKNIDGIYSLPHLEEITSTNQNIDYTRFPNLRRIGAELSDFSYETLADLTTLEDVSISNNFKEKDVTIFSKNNGLRFLMLRGSKVTSLKGLENFKKLECLHLFHNKYITSLEGIVEEHNYSLKDVSVYVAPKLFYVNEYLSKLSNLEHLQLHCKKVDSLLFLDNLTNLHLCSIHNKVIQVEDENKTPLIEALKRTNGKIW
ncbi:leucine-rich repeat domain-containing protein [Flavobacterium sp.]|uniref:leucine-rich repeat domain-containing protein n=1 Tax=Flavobacterium sp. TaxID=239 RepID=UPI004047DF41